MEGDQICTIWLLIPYTRSRMYKIKATTFVIQPSCRSAAEQFGVSAVYGVVKFVIVFPRKAPVCGNSIFFLVMCIFTSYSISPRAVYKKTLYCVLPCRNKNPVFSKKTQSPIVRRSSANKKHHASAPGMHAEGNILQRCPTILKCM